MVVNKRKKVTRQRGNTWHGWGRGKAHHKGAGNRGGRGRAGSGKRGDAKKPSYQAKGYLGKNGFTSKSRKKIVAINIEKLQELMIKNDIKGKIDLSTIGFDKLLGTGNVLVKLEITCKQASAKAVAKVEAAGGKVNLPVVEEKPKAESKPKKEKKKEEVAESEDEQEEEKPEEKEEDKSEPEEAKEEITEEEAPEESEPEAVKDEKKEE